jgi:hypothetical protein
VDQFVAWWISLDLLAGLLPFQPALVTSVRGGRLAQDSSRNEKKSLHSSVLYKGLEVYKSIGPDPDPDPLTSARISQMRPAFELT